MMVKRLVLPAIISTALGLPLLPHTDFEYNLVRHRGNKIVLLGDWKAADIGKWREIIDSDGVYEYGFTLLNREKLMEAGDNLLLSINESNINAFERWILQKYDLSMGGKWVVLDNENRCITAGIQAPSPAELGKILEMLGIKSPLRKVRDFLAANPGHVEAKSDLLIEVRRRALQKMPPNVTGDLDTGSDLRIWGVLAAETDKAFSGSWVGIDLNFFAPHKSQPEKYSKLMKNVFRKHISKVESAIISDPANSTLWNVWAWMARSSPDYNWSTFISSIEPFEFNRGIVQSPASDVCVWIVDESRIKKDWDTVIKYARLARNFHNEIPISMDIKIDWSPGGSRGFYNIPSSPIEGYPATSAYAPHLEALLRLGDTEGANNVYDEMIMLEGKTGISEFKTNNALVAANVARSVGMGDLAKIWEQGELINKAPYQKSSVTGTAWGRPYWYVFAGPQSDYFKKFLTLVSQLSPRLIANYSQWEGDDVLGWKIADGERWALFSAYGRPVAQGTDIPDKDVMQNIIKSNGINSSLDFYRRYIAERGSTPGIELLLAYEIIDLNNNAPNTDQGSAISEDSRDELKWGEAVRLLRGTFNNPEILLNLYFPPNRTPGPGAVMQSRLMKSLSKPYLSVIESSLEKKPSLLALWNLWFFWRSTEAGERPLEPLIEIIKYSPLSSIETLPSTVIEAYYQECRKNGKWSNVIGLLEMVWKREFLRNNGPQDGPDPKDEMSRYTQSFARQVAADLGDRVAIPLIEAYLNDNRPREADDIFNAWLGSGGSFKDILKIVELAKTKGQERLAKEWEEKTKK